MPRVRRRVLEQRPDLSDLTRDQRYHLETGLVFFEGLPDLETFREAWKLYRDEILPAFVREHPGQRPFAWWLLEHRKERPIVDARPDAKEWEKHEREDRWNRRRFGYLHTDFIPALQEDETEYLARKRLLTAEERKLLLTDTSSTST
jgi:hypothetical protein